MSTPSLSVYELRINISTIIPGQPKQTTFNRSMLYNPESKTQSSFGLSNNPLFTFQARYPTANIAKSYDSIVEFFFNKQVFETTLKNEPRIDAVAPPDTKNASGNYSDEYNKYCEEKNDITTHNIMAMLLLLFPTRYPVINDVHDSYSIHIGSSNLKPLFFNPLSKNRFSYLKIGSETYTTQRVIWKNDMMNHPEYREFLINASRGYPGKKSTNEYLNNLTISSNDRRKQIQVCYDSSCEESTHKIYTGVDIVGSSKTAEIYVMMDFIKGEVNKSNMKSIFCSLFGEIAGNKLEKLYKELTATVKVNPHYVDANRYMFSLKDMKTINVEDKPDTKTSNNAEYMKIENEYNKISDYARQAFEDACNALQYDTRFTDSLNEIKFDIKKLLLELKQGQMRDLETFKAIESFRSGKRMTNNELNRLISRITTNARDIENRMYVSHNMGRDNNLLNLAKLKIMLLEKLKDLYPTSVGRIPGGGISNRGRHLSTKIRHSRKNNKRLRKATKKRR